MILKKINFWYINSFLISILVALPIITVFFGFFESTSDYFLLLKNTFLLTYISNSVFADVCESLIGAIYIDGGFMSAKNFVEKINVK